MYMYLVPGSTHAQYYAHTISILEHDPDVFQYRRSVRIVIDQQQWSHLRVIETAVWHPHITKPAK